MDGHLEQAAAVLKAAADRMPIEQVMAAVEELDEAVNQIRLAGANVGQQLAETASGIQDRLRDEAGALDSLREQLQSVAEQAVSFGGY